MRDAAQRTIWCILCLLLASVSTAGDWPQILGPQRNGQAADDESLLAKWPADGPKETWRCPVGTGFAGPAVVGQEIYLFHRQGDSERLQRFDASTGETTWTVDFEATYQGSINPDSGPRCVPLIHGPHVYLFGAAGDLHCVARKDGSKQWSRATHDELQASEGYFGAGSTPIAMNNVLLVNIGGRPNAGIAAFALDTGKTVWQKTDERASYAAPTRATIDGKEYAVFVTRYNAMAVDPTTGDVRFRIPFGQRGPTVNAATPLVFDNRLFVTAAYGVGCKFARIDADTPQVVWSNNDSLSSQYNTPIRDGHFLYGIHGREDVGRAELRCIDSRDGSVQWNEPDFGVAHLVLADRKLLLLTVDGKLTLAEPDVTRFKTLATAQVSDKETRALPALANGRFYFRDNQRAGGALVCLQVGQ